MRVSIDKQLYSDITSLSYIDELENVMLIGAIQSGENIDTSVQTFKWFCPAELKTQTGSNAVVKETDMAKGIKDILDLGYNTIIMIHTHPCKEEVEDWVYASLSEDDLTAAKNVEFMCNLQGANFYVGVSTCNAVYFWRLDNRSLKPIQMECYVENENVTKKVPTSLKEIVEQMQN